MREEEKNKSKRKKECNKSELSFELNQKGDLHLYYMLLTNFIDTSLYKFLFLLLLKYIGMY